MPAASRRSTKMPSGRSIATLTMPALASLAPRAAIPSSSWVTEKRSATLPSSLMQTSWASAAQSIPAVIVLAAMLPPRSIHVGWLPATRSRCACS